MSMLTFNVIDVETANSDRASICQIGIVHVRDGQIVDQWQTLVNPEDRFSSRNIKIHKIDESAVRNSPLFPDVHDELCTRLSGTILISHTAFDRIAFERVMQKYGLDQLQVTWLDSAIIARRAWPEHYYQRGYGLKNLTKDFGISFNHHDALEDARAAAEIVLHACHATGIDISGWLSQIKSPIYSSPSGSRIPITREGNLEGPLFGETILFSGKLSIPRNQAADIAAKAGCNVVSDTRKKITILVLGTQNLSKVSGNKTRKHKRVETLISRGKEIQILSETDFYKLIDFDS